MTPRTADRREVLVLTLVDYPGNPEPTDHAGRVCNGWYDGMPDDVCFTLNRWDWRFSRSRAATCSHVLFTYQREVKVVAEITGIDGPYEITREDGRPQKRCAVRGRVLAKGDAAYDRWYGEDDLPGTDNRVEYNFIQP